MQLCMPRPAELLRLKPGLQAEQSTVLLASHRVPPVPDDTVAVPDGQVHVMALQVRVLKVPPVSHVAVPPPV